MQQSLVSDIENIYFFSVAPGKQGPILTKGIDFAIFPRFPPFLISVELEAAGKNDGWQKGGEMQARRRGASLPIATLHQETRKALRLFRNQQEKADQTPRLLG